MTAAARRLGFSQAALSSQLAAAESALGVSLFERHGRGVVPTDVGRTVVVRIGEVFEAFQALRDEADGTHRPPLTIGATEPTVPRLLPFLRRVERKRANVRFEMRVETSTEIHRLIELGELEIAISGEQHARMRAATFQPLYEQELVLLVPSSHVLAKRRYVEFAQLHAEQVLVGEDPCLYRRLVERSLDDAHVDVVIRARFGALSTLPAAVSAGFGVAIVPREIVDPPPSGTVSLRLRKPIVATIGLLLRRDASESTRRLAADLRAAFS